MLATRMARLARAQHRAGGWFTAGNPEGNFLRLLSPTTALRVLLGVALWAGDQCALGGPLPEAHRVAHQRDVDG
eukprot:6989140-Alexandrium_andersonii.AAC.1